MLLSEYFVMYPAGWSRLQAGYDTWLMILTCLYDDADYFRGCL